MCCQLPHVDTQHLSEAVGTTCLVLRCSGPCDCLIPLTSKSCILVAPCVDACPADACPRLIFHFGSCALAQTDTVDALTPTSESKSMSVYVSAWLAVSVCLSDCLLVVYPSPQLCKQAHQSLLVVILSCCLYFQQHSIQYQLLLAKVTISCGANNCPFFKIQSVHLFSDSLSDHCSDVSVLFRPSAASSAGIK